MDLINFVIDRYNNLNEFSHFLKLFLWSCNIHHVYATIRISFAAIDIVHSQEQDRVSFAFHSLSFIRSLKSNKHQAKKMGKKVKVMKKGGKVCTKNHTHGPDCIVACTKKHKHSSSCVVKCTKKHKHTSKCVL